MTSTPPPTRPALTALGAALLAAVLATGCREERGRLNLVLISLDTCRADRLSCYGAERRNTPHLDALAAESVRFLDCRAQSCVTAPSHMSMLTGHYVHRHGLRRNGMQSRPPYSLASALRERGWRTAAFTGHGSFQAKFGHDEGFEVFQSWIGPEEWPFTRNVAEVVPHALAWLDEHEQEPFFLMVHGYDPHCPYWPPEPWRGEFAGWYEGELRPERLCGPPEFLRLIERGLVGEEELRYVSDLYDAELALADQVLGEFLDELERRGLLERSIVVFTSDHGEALGAKDRVGHGALTREILDVPLLIRFPDGRAGERPEPVELVDLVPTLLTALGVAVPEGVEGVDLTGLIDGGPVPWQGERMRIAQANENYCLRFDDRWKVNFGLQPDGRLSKQALYDLQADPDEERNLFAEREGKERFRAYTRHFLRWREGRRAEDEALYRATTEGTSAEDQKMLEALGYGD